MRSRQDLINWLIDNEINATQSDDPEKQINALKQLAIDMLLSGFDGYDYRETEELQELFDDLQDE